MNKIFKYIGKLSLATVVASAMFSCTSDPQSPGVEYMPDMYRSPSYETYIKKGDLDSASLVERLMEERPDLDETEIMALYNRLKTGYTHFMPVKGTVPVGFTPFAYAQSPEEYERAGLELKNPLPFSDSLVKQGKELYDIFCDHCHGEKGEGDGQMVKNDVFPAPPSYTAALKDLPEGKIFYTIHYGKGNMGSHASQISQTERWKIVYYVQKLQGKLNAPAVADSAVVADTNALKK